MRVCDLVERDDRVHSGRQLSGEPRSMRYSELSRRLAGVS
jgi:hypothetical protein